MAAVTNVVLKVDKDGDREVAQISYDIEFTDAEIEHNIGFLEWIMLYERDGALDQFSPSAESLGHVQRAEGNMDDTIGPIFPAERIDRETAYIRPDGARSIHRFFDRTWDFPRNESGPEEYRALVRIFPDIWADFAWSNEVSANLVPPRSSADSEDNLPRLI